MNTKKLISTVKLADWIHTLTEAAEKDEPFSIAWFGPTKDKPFSIIGGWMEGFSEDYSDLLCISKSNPKYAMCIKIAVNEGPYAYTDFEIMNMPFDPETNEVDDTCIALEYEEDYEAMALFFLNEWERIMKEHQEAEDEE
jgi:hypothetical protein